MTTLPAAGYISNNARTEGEDKTWREDLLAFVREGVGGSAETELTIAAGAIAPTSGHHAVDTEADAASDDLATIGQATLADGRFLSLRCADNARVVTVKHGAGGTGQVFLAGAADLKLDNTTRHLLLQRRGTAWYEVFRFHHVPTPAAADAGKALMVASSGAVVLAGPLTGARRNMLDNGGMMVAQRGSATGVGASSIQTVIDRWTLQSFSSASARWTITLEGLGGVSGHAPWMKLLCTTADASPGADEAQAIYQSVEAQNLYGRMFVAPGTWRASKLSLDIIVGKGAGSSIAFPATLCVLGQSQDGTVRTLIATFTVTAADTWQRVSVDIPADSTIAVNNDNGVGMTIGLGLYGGSNRQTGTVNAWQTAGSTVVATATSANLADAANNYIGITNVQWEVGVEATPFENVDISEEEDRCFRWFERIETAIGNGHLGAVGRTYSSTAGDAFLRYRKKRTTPTATLTAADTFAWFPGTGGSPIAVSAISASALSITGCQINVTVSGAGVGGGMLLRDVTDTTTIDISAE